MDLFYLGYPKGKDGKRRTFRAGIKCDKKGVPGEMVAYTEPQEVSLPKADAERFLSDHGKAPDLLFALEPTEKYIAESELAEVERGLEPEENRMAEAPDHTASGDAE